MQYQAKKNIKNKVKLNAPTNGDNAVSTCASEFCAPKPTKKKHKHPAICYTILASLCLAVQAVPPCCAKHQRYCHPPTSRPRHAP